MNSSRIAVTAGVAVAVGVPVGVAVAVGVGGESPGLFYLVGILVNAYSLAAQFT